MPKKAAFLFVALGAVLILSALLLFLKNRQEGETAGVYSEKALIEIQTVIAAQRPEKELAPQTVPTDEREESEILAVLKVEMPVVAIGGYDYIGYLSIPTLELELPVMADWDYHRLQLAPCRQFGSIETDDLVIAAHNYVQHFAYLYRLQAGDPVTFTNLEGVMVSYTVIATASVEETDVDAVQNSGYDLVLYTCTYKGPNRVVVFCDRVTEETKG